MSSQEPVTSQTMPRGLHLEMLIKNFEKLSNDDRTLFSNGSMYLGVNAGFAGLIANSFFRRLLNVTQGRITSSLPMATLPFLTTVALYNATVTNPLLLGELNCPTCVVVRGALVGVAAAGVYPLILALPVNAGLASRYNTAPMPEKGNIMRYWVNATRPVVRKMTFIFVLQGVFGAYVSNRHFDIYLTLLKLSGTDDELHD